MKELKVKIAVGFLLFFICSLAQGQTDKSTFPLEPNKITEQEIIKGQTHAYEIKADKESFLHITVDQKSVDVAIILFSQDGQKVSQIDNPNITRGPEQIFFITTGTGVHRIEISSKETGRYTVKIEALRSATPQDKNILQADRLFIEAERLSAASQNTQALTKYEEALNLIKGSSYRYDEATILYSLGKTHDTLGNKEKAIEFIKKSLLLFQTGGSWDEVFRDLSTLYLFMGGKQKTFDYLAGAVPLVRALKNDRLEAILLTGLAKVCEDMNEQAKALDFTSQSLALYRITGKRGAEVFTMTEISDADLSLEDKKKAVDYLNQALLLAQSASDKALEVTLLFGIGYVYASIDERQNALNYFRQTLSLWRELKDKNGEAYALNFIGTSFRYLGDNITARDYFEQANKLFQEAGDARASAHTLLNLGTVERGFGDIQKASDLYQKALKIFRDANDKDGEASALNCIAEIYWANGDKQKTLENHQKVLSIYRVLGSRVGEADALTNLGFIYEYLGDIEQTFSCYNQALPIFRLLGDQTGEAIALYGLARVSYTRGQVDEALKQIEGSIKIIESLRIKIASSDLRASYLATYRHFYELYIDILMQLNQSRAGQGFDTRALEVSERARARSLLDILNEARADIRQGIDPVLLERERALQIELNRKEQARLKRLTSQERNEELEKEIRTLTTKYQELQAEIKLKSPRYAALTQPQPINTKEIQQLLDADTILLEYHLGYYKSYLWVVSKDSVKTFYLPKREEIESAARQFYETVKEKKTSDKAHIPAKNLSKIILEPAASELGNKRLLIVADGALQYIPFAALPSPKSKVQSPTPASETNNSELRTQNSELPLIVNNEIVYLPSSSVLSLIRTEASGRQPAPKTLAVIADPVFTLDDPRMKKTKETEKSIAQTATTQLPQSTLRNLGLKEDAGFKIARLPGTKDEAEQILALIPEPQRKQALGFDANRATVTSDDMSKYRIIHFATHGVLDSEHPELSGVILSLLDEKGNTQDGFLRLHEIFNLKLPADLIVLSACQTGLGKDIKGEGLVGLTRGFMYAGALRVTATLWEVPDSATAELMKIFYQGMLGEKHLRPAAALREAQIQMWKTKNRSAPYYWSAFTIQGEWQ